MMREKGIDEEETERRFSRGERIGADPLAPRGRPPLEHTAGDGQRLRRAHPPRPMPCNLYRRHCLTAPSRRRATASTRHHPRVIGGSPFFPFFSVARISVHFFWCGQRDDAILDFFLRLAGCV